MRKHRSTIGALGALSIVLLAPFVGTAQAAAPADRGAGEQILTAPAAPEGAETATARGAAAVAPTLSPGADFQHVAPGGTFGCKAGEPLHVGLGPDQVEVEDLLPLHLQPVLPLQLGGNRPVLEQADGHTDVDLLRPERQHDQELQAVLREARPELVPRLVHP